VVLGRSAGLSDEQMAHLLDDPLPEGLYAPDEAAIIRFSRRSTKMEPIDNRTWADLTAHFDTRAIMEIVFIVGMDQVISRMHAALRTDLDGVTSDEIGDTCAVPMPQLAPEGSMS
jgi:hypothetical protein